MIERNGDYFAIEMTDEFPRTDVPRQRPQRREQLCAKERRNAGTVRIARSNDRSARRTVNLDQPPQHISRHAGLIAKHYYQRLDRAILPLDRFNTRTNR